MRRRLLLMICGIALSALVGVGSSLHADDDKLAGKLMQELDSMKDQVRTQLSDIYGEGSSQVTDGFDGELRKLDVQGRQSGARAIGKCIVYVHSVNRALVELYGSSDYAVKVPDGKSPLSDVDGAIMTDLIGRVEDIQKVLKIDWQHKPK